MTKKLNKDKEALMEQTKQLLEDFGEKFRDELERLDGKAFCDKYMALMEYAIPKLASQKIDTNGSMAPSIFLVPISNPSQLPDIKAIDNIQPAELVEE